MRREEPWLKIKDWIYSSIISTLDTHIIVNIMDYTQKLATLKNLIHPPNANLISKNANWRTEMNQKEAELLPAIFPEMVTELLKESAEGAIQTLTWFTNTLYDQGYVILSPREVKFYEKRLNER